MRAYAFFAALTFGACLTCFSQEHPLKPENFLRAQMRLSTNQIADIRKGKAIAKIVTSAKPSDIFVFGAIYIRAEPSAYLALMSDIDRLKKMPGYLGAGRFSETGQRSDLEGFSLDPNDIKDLRKCKPGDCALQLPEESIEKSQHFIDWAASDVLQQVNARAELGMLRLLEAYKHQGNQALGTYQDKPNPSPVAEQFKSLLSNVGFFPQYLPELNRYLLDYPKERPERSHDFFYWEKVNFGLKPTIRLNHAIAYRSDSTEQSVSVLAIKQLYASHYFQAALDLSSLAFGFWVLLKIQAFISLL